MSVDPDIETEADLWRWYTQIYLSEIIEPPNGLSLIVEKLKESDLSKVFNNVKKIFMPKKMDIGGQSSDKPTTDTPSQKGGGLFCQKDYKINSYYTFRLEAYNDLITYLSNNQIKISLLTKQLLKKLYLYHYSLEYVKALKYVLFKIKKHTLPMKLRNRISNVFEQISNELYNKLIT